MFEFPIYKAFIVHDLVMGIPRTILYIIYGTGLLVILAAGQIWYSAVVLILHFIVYFFTKYFDPNFIEIIMRYFLSEDRFY